MTAKRPSLAQDLLWRLEAFAFDLVTGLARMFPIDAVSDFGARLFQWLGPMTSAHRVAETNLRIVFPKWTAWHTGYLTSTGLSAASIANQVRVRDAAGTLLAVATSASAGNLTVQAPAGGWPSGDVVVELHAGLAATSGASLAAAVALTFHRP